MTRPLSSYIIAVSLCSLLLATSVLNAAHASLFDTPDSSGSTQTITVSQSAYLNNPQYKKALTTFKALNSKLQVMARQKDMTKKEFFVKIAGAINNIAIKSHKTGLQDKSQMYGYLAFLMNKEIGITTAPLSFTTQSTSPIITNNNTKPKTPKPIPIVGFVPDIVVDATDGYQYVNDIRIKFNPQNIFVEKDGVIYIQTNKIKNNVGDRKFEIRLTANEYDAGLKGENPFGGPLPPTDIKVGDIITTRFTENQTVKVDADWLISKTNEKHLPSIMELFQNEVEKLVGAGMSIDDATQTTMNNIDAYQQKVLSVTNDSMSDEQKIMAVAVLVTQDYARNNNVGAFGSEWSHYTFHGVFTYGNAACEGLFSAYTLGMFLAKVDADIGYQIGMLTSGASHITAYINGRASDITAINTTFSAGSKDLYTSATFDTERSKISENYLGW